LLGFAVGDLQDSPLVAPFLPRSSLVHACAMAHPAIFASVFAAAGVAAISVITGWIAPPSLASASAASDPILSVHAGSLTTYLPSASSAIQGIRPQVGQRGVDLDGGLRAGAPFGMAIEGNPFEGGFGGASAGSVNLFTGAPEVSPVDLALPSEGIPWVIGRTYNPRQLTSGSAHQDSNGYQGKNWFQTSQPAIQLYEHPSDDKEDVLYLVYGADRFVEYQRVAISGSPSATTFRGKNGAAGVFLLATGAGSEPDTYTLTDQVGNKWTFFGFDGDAGTAAGQFWKSETTSGKVAYVGHATTGSTAISTGYSSGRILTAYDAEDRRYTYTYTTLDGVSRLTEVKAETKTSGTWSSPSGVATVGEVDYAYYTNETFGDVGDLKLVTRTTPLTDVGIDSVAKTYYRYYEGSYNSVTNPGYPHCLKYVVGAEGTRRHDWQDLTFDDDFLTETEANLKPYAEAYYAYDTSYRVKEGWFNGRCGCSGASNGTHTLDYQTNGSYSDTSGYTDNWSARTVVGLPDGSFETQHFDEVGQALTLVKSDDDPSGSPAPGYWVTHVDRDASGRVVTVFTPAAVSSYTHSTGAVSTAASAGLVDTYQRETSGATTGFLLSTKWAQGASGTQYFDGARTYSSASLTVGDDAVVRPVIATSTEYTQAITSGTTGTNTTSLATTFYSGSLAIEKVVTTHPLVSTSNNGSGSATTESVYLDQRGRTLFVKGADGIIGFTKYAGGLATVSVEDADTTQTGAGQVFNGVTIPSGFSSTAGALHRVTTMVYDAQGRQSESTDHEGRVSKRYFSRLLDRRLLSLSYPDYEASPEKFYGPASLSLVNLAGQGEASGSVAISGGSTTTAVTGHIDETQADLIAAVDLGTLASLSTQTYAASGYTLENSRAYFLIPTSLPGTDGTHYDQTSFAYDTLGRRVRTLAPHGTISRVTFDGIGRQIESWVGTNDFGELGGSSSGTNNMTRLSLTTYDGGSAGGNSLVTQTTVYKDSSTGDSTSYAYDVRGRVLLTTNPTAPHLLVAYDNLGRQTVSAGYSSTASIVVGTDEPVTEATNRLSLSRTYYDERGQVWKTTRHQIDAADGSDDDNLEELVWYDAMGREIKRDGHSLSKSLYDRIGREVRSYELASHNDTGYSDADDVVGDIVLAESLSGFDGDDLVLSARIDRRHSDFGSGQTTGALDTNADSNSLILTAADLKGRVQIEAAWHDRFGRATGQASYGTNGETTFNRTTVSSVPASADNNPASTTVFGDDGRVKTMTDALGHVTYREYDALGRVTKEVENYSASVNSGNPSGADDNQTVRYEYVDGLRAKIIADVPSPGTDQETVYTYGTVKGSSAGDSKIATGHLLKTVAYPDSTGASDVVSYAYDARSRQIWTKDQAGNVTEMAYDASGRLTSRAVSTLATGFDGAVRRIETGYDSLGRRLTVTQYDASSGGGVVDQVKYGYDGWSNVTSFAQDTNSAVGQSGSVDDYALTHAYAKATGGRNSVRRTGSTYPSGKSVTYTYSNSAGLFDADMSRVSGVNVDGTLLVRYAYLGSGQLARTAYPSIGLQHQLYDSANAYNRVDRFNRMTTVSWEEAATAYKAYDVTLAWDRGGNILSVDDKGHTGFDFLYSIDDLDRVTRAHRGTLSGGSISTAKQDQRWTLDHLGNWSQNRFDLNGDGDFTDAEELDELRGHNAVNEILDRDTNGDSTPEFTLAYDAVGQLTDDGEDYKYTWDAFGRMRKILKRSNDALVEEIRYNGLGFMIGEHYDADEDLDVDSNDPWYYHAYDERWRQIATYRGADTSPKEEWVLHQAGLDGLGGSSYINAIALRDRDHNTAWTSASDGTREQRIFYSQNWRGDVVALTKSDGTQVEQVRYTAYGIPFGLPAGDLDSDGDCDAADETLLDGIIAASGYDVRGDLDTDGDCDATDKAQIATGSTLGASAMSKVGQRFGSQGSGSLSALQVCHTRYRLHDPRIGVWSSRDPLLFVEGFNVYSSFKLNPISLTDPYGLSSTQAKSDDEPFGAQPSSPGPCSPVGFKQQDPPKFVTVVLVWSSSDDPSEICDLYLVVERTCTGGDDYNRCFNDCIKLAKQNADYAASQLRNAPSICGLPIGAAAVTGGTFGFGLGKAISAIIAPLTGPLMPATATGITAATTIAGAGAGALLAAPAALSCMMDKVIGNNNAQEALKQKTKDCHDECGEAHGDDTYWKHDNYYKVECPSTHW
jgi:RHS repeat-associated protein